MNTFIQMLVVTAVMAALPVCGQGVVTLVGPSVRNGSFEDGLPSPWGGVSIVTLDASFASHGEWFADLSETANGSVARTDSWQYIAVNSQNGRTFTLTFDARIGAVGFDSIAASISDFFLVADQTLIAFPALGSNGWASYHMNFAFPESWDGENIRLSIRFTKSGAIPSTTYTGYLDNVVLAQVPEPSTLALAGLGGLCLFARWRRLESGQLP